MDYLLDELGGNVTYQDLYKLHTGHRLHGFSDDSDTGSESGLEHLKPPPYTYEELEQNLVIVEKPLDKELNSKFANENTFNYSKSLHSSPSTLEEVTMKSSPAHSPQENFSPKQPATPSEKVSQKLSQLITKKFCFICHKPSRKHYKQESHYRKVTKWLELQINDIMQPVDIKLIFCQICNLSLSGNDEAKKHYEEKAHKEKAKSFCVQCLRVIEAIDMPGHLNSKKHLANIDSTAFHTSESDKNTKKTVESAENKTQPPVITHDSLQQRTENQMPSSIASLKEGPQHSATKTYASVLRGDVSKKTTPERTVIETKQSEPFTAYTTKQEPETTNQRGSVPLYNPFAIILIEQIRRTYCYLCDESALREKGQHYRKKQHYKVLREWIEKNGKSFGYDMSNIDSVICFPCHYIFLSFTAAQQHYWSEEHKKFSKYYCSICMTHDNSDIHKNHGTNLEEESEVHVSTKREKVNTNGHILQTEKNGSNVSNIALTNLDVESFKDAQTEVKQDQHKEPASKRQSIKLILKAPTPKSNLAPTHSKNKSPTLPDNKSVNLLQLGLRLDQHSTEIDEPADLCKNIFAEYRQLITALETVPLDLCSSYLRKFNKEISEKCDRLDECKMESRTISGDAYIKNDQNTQQNGVIRSTYISGNNNPCASLNSEIVKLKNILTKSFNSRFSVLTLHEIKEVIMFVRNVQKALKIIETEVRSFNIVSVFQFTSENYPLSPDWTGKRDGFEYNAYKFTLKEEIDELCNFINNQEALHPIIVLDCLVQFNKNLLEKDEYDSEEKLDECFYKMESDESLIYNDVRTQANTKNGTTKETDSDNIRNNNSYLKSHKLVPKEVISDLQYTLSSKDIISNYQDCVTDSNSDTSFESAVECLCESGGPLCSSYLGKVSKEIGEIYEKCDNLDKSKMQSSEDAYMENDQDTQQNRAIRSTYIFGNSNPCASLNSEIVNLKSIWTKSFNRRFSVLNLNEIKGVIMFVRNFQKALEIIETKVRSFNIVSVFQFTCEEYPCLSPDWAGTLDAFEDNVWKFILKEEIDELCNFINSQETLHPNIVLDWLVQFNKKLLEKKEYESEENSTTKETDLDNIGNSNSYLKSQIMS